MKKCKTTHARHDHAHCLVPGLFRSLKRGERKREKLDLLFTLDEENSVRFIGFEPLGADDLRFLQGLLALSGPDGIILSSDPVTETGVELWHKMEIQGDAKKKKCIVVKTTFYSLLSEIGVPNNGTYIRAFKESLLRLSNVTIVMRSGAKEGTCHLLSYAIDDDTGLMCVSLNPLLARAVMGGRHVRIEMPEVRALKSAPARLIHQRLCAWINPGGSGRVHIDTLCEYAWPTPAGAEAMKDRRQTARRALDELRSLGWTVAEYVADKFIISRPRLTTKRSPNNDKTFPE